MDDSKIIKDYDILKQIGRGSYASVYKAINKNTGETCAIKKISSNNEWINLVFEISIMKDSNFKNIVRYIDSDFLKDELFIVMEYCEGGSIKDVMRQLGRNLDPDQIVVVLKDVLSGLDYLHHRKNIHRDVKAANILLDKHGVAKLGDFGVSEKLDSSDKKQTIIGTVRWLPPEVINKEPYSTAVDIWSLGITMIEMGDGAPPYSSLEDKDALSEIANLNKPPPDFKNPEYWPAPIREFLSMCLDKDPSKRKGSRHLLETPLIRGACSNNILKELVHKVCAKPPNSNESELTLCKDMENSLKEVQILYRIYKEHRLKVVRVDQMEYQLKSAKKEFDKLHDRMAKCNSQIENKRDHLNKLTDENQKLEREKNDLESTFQKSVKRKVDFVRELEKYGIQLNGRSS